MIANSNRNSILFILLLSVFYYIGLGNVHLFDWDEINFAECAREMIETGNYFRVQIDFIPFWEKTPLFFWLQVLAMKIFGMNEFAARFPNALFGTITLLSLYGIGKKHYTAKYGLVWAIVYFGSLLPHLYFKSGIIDPIFNYFIFLSVYFVIRAMHGTERNNAMAFLAGIASGLAVLTKGPVGFLLLFLTIGVYILLNRFKVWPKLSHIGLFALAILMITGTWFGIDILNHGTQVLEKFITYQIDLFRSPVAGHEQPFYYHFVVVLLGCFPMSVIAIASFWDKSESPLQIRFWMKCLFWVVIILFSIVTTKIVHYSSMTYLPLSLLATSVIMKPELVSPRIRKLIFFLFCFIGITLALLIVALPAIPLMKDTLIPMIKDPFAVEALKLPVNWTGVEFICGIPLLVSVLIGIKALRSGLWIRSVTGIAVGLALTLSLTLYLILPKIEQYSQGTAIDFYESISEEEVYVATYGFKSYAQFFYFGLKNEGDERRRDMHWLLEGDIDRPTYFVTKINNTDLDEKSHIELIEAKGGFKFYRRSP